MADISDLSTRKPRRIEYIGGRIHLCNIPDLKIRDTQGLKAGQDAEIKLVSAR